MKNWCAYILIFYEAMERIVTKLKWIYCVQYKKLFNFLGSMYSKHFIIKTN